MVLAVQSMFYSILFYRKAAKAAYIKRRNGMYQILFIILCVVPGYVAYKYAGSVRSDGSALCRKNCDKCNRKCWSIKEDEHKK